MKFDVSEEALKHLELSKHSSTDMKQWDVLLTRKLVNVVWCMVQSQYVRVTEVYRSATFVTTRTSTPADVRKFFRLVRATKYVQMYTA